VKVPYVGNSPERGGLSSPSEADIARMIRDGVESWRPRRGPDWQDLMSKVRGSGPSTWLLYTVASAALVVILISAFIVGSALHIGALAPQPIHSNQSGPT
jgi:hypothetical protein